MKPHVLKILAGSACALALAGCSYGPHGYGGPPAGVSVVYVQKAPPPRPHVALPPRPVSSAVWIAGYWDWTGSNYVWVDGHWLRNPPHGKRWMPGKWIQSPRGWYWNPGRWH